MGQVASHDGRSSPEEGERRLQHPPNTYRNKMLHPGNVLLLKNGYRVPLLRREKPLIAAGKRVPGSLPLGTVQLHGAPASTDEWAHAPSVASRASWVNHVLMGTVTEYLENVSEANRGILERIVGIARELAPDAEEGVSYGMPALLVNGKGFLSVLETKKLLALYPFSGQILPEMSEELGGYSWSPGTLRFSADNPVPDSLVRRILETRLAAIRR